MEETNNSSLSRLYDPSLVETPQRPGPVFKDGPYLPARRALEQMAKDGTPEAKAAISAVLGLIDAGDVQRLPSAIAAAVEAVVPLSFERLDDPRRQRNALVKTWVEQALDFAAGHLDV